MENQIQSFLWVGADNTTFRLGRTESGRPEFIMIKSDARTFRIPLDYDAEDKLLSGIAALLAEHPADAPPAPPLRCEVLLADGRTVYAEHAAFGKFAEERMREEMSEYAAKSTVETTCAVACPTHRRLTGMMSGTPMYGMMHFMQMTAPADTEGRNP